MDSLEGAKVSRLEVSLGVNVVDRVATCLDPRSTAVFLSLLRPLDIHTLVTQRVLTFMAQFIKVWTFYIAD